MGKTNVQIATKIAFQWLKKHTKKDIPAFMLVVSLAEAIRPELDKVYKKGVKDGRRKEHERWMNFLVGRTMRVKMELPEGFEMPKPYWGHPKPIDKEKVSALISEIAKYTQNAIDDIDDCRSMYVKSLNQALQKLREELGIENE